MAADDASSVRRLLVLRRAAAVALCIIAVLAVAGIGGLSFDSHYSAYFDDGDPRLVEHNDIAATYSRRDSVLIVLESTERDLLDHELYFVLEDLTADLSRRPYAATVDSISELGIQGDSETAEGILIPSIGQLRAHDRATGLLISDDVRVAAIRVQAELDDASADAVRQMLRDLRAVVDARIASLPLEAHYSGTLALSEAYIDIVRRDVSVILPLLVGSMVVVLAWLLGSVRSVVAVLPVGVLSAIAAFGAGGLLRVELAAINSFVPVIILSVSLAGCVHMVLSYQHYRRRSGERQRAAVQAARFNLLPMTLANATTTAGFLCLLLSPSPPVRALGFLVAAGVATSFVLCMTLLPVLLAKLDPRAARRVPCAPLIGSTSVFVHRWQTPVIAVFALSIAPATWLLANNTVSDSVFEYFADSHPFAVGTRIVESRLSGINEMLISVDTGGENRLYDAAVVDAIAGFSAWLREQPEVRRVASLTDSEVILEARRDGRLQERLDHYRQRSADAEYASPLLAQEVSADFSSAIVTAFLAPLDSASMVAFDRRVRSWSEVNFADMRVTTGGASLIFAYLGENNIRSMLFALAVALALAAVVLGVTLRSVRIAAIGLVCNILPVLLVYSMWAVTEGRISLGASVVLGMILGIVVDDTIYLLASYRRSAACGDPDPVQRALVRIGPALVVTTLTLAAGLGFGLLSAFGPIWSMSALSVAIILLALVTDLLLLPALLLSIRASNESEQHPD